MIATNYLDGDMPLADWQGLDEGDSLLLDVREPEEYAAGHVPGAVNFPLSSLRRRYQELPTERPIVAYCKVGQRAYYAVRFLAQRGYRVANLSGGYTTYEALRPSR
jgi:rhodanese-related sulfurtransferase